MIISRTPFRVSLFGGGTDYPKFYKEHGGIVIGTAINKYCYITVRNLPPFFEHKHRIVYSKVELPNEISEIEHPSVKAVLSELDVSQGIEIQHQADLPARSGLGSSSSFTVGLLNSIRAMQGKVSSPELLGKESIRIEQNVIKEHVGSQDQIWAAYGGTNAIEFNTNGEICVAPLIMKPKTTDVLNSHMMLFFTGLTRFSTNIAVEKINNIDKKYRELESLKSMAIEAKNILQHNVCDIKTIGEMLHESWMLKQNLADGVSNNFINDMYLQAKNCGAYGGKLLGAGGGGFMMFLAHPKDQEKIKKQLSDFIYVDVKTGACGSKIVMYEPNGFY